MIVEVEEVIEDVDVLDVEEVVLDCGYCLFGGCVWCVVVDGCGVRGVRWFG